jgi:single-strand DNA-binding protein
MSLNVVTLVGRVGGEPDVRHFESGSVKCRLTLAVRRTKDVTDWFNLEIWGKTAGIAEQYVNKGSLIGVKGVLKFDTWVDRNTGANRMSPVVVVDQLNLLGSRRDNEGGQQSGNGGYSDDF